jgi:hypothetical protein
LSPLGACHTKYIQGGTTWALSVQSTSGNIGSFDAAGTTLTWRQGQVFTKLTGGVGLAGTWRYNGRTLTITPGSNRFQFNFVQGATTWSYVLTSTSGSIAHISPNGALAWTLPNGATQTWQKTGAMQLNEIEASEEQETEFEKESLPISVNSTELELATNWYKYICKGAEVQARGCTMQQCQYCAFSCHGSRRPGFPGCAAVLHCCQ